MHSSQNLDVLVIDGEGSGGMTHYANCLAEALARQCKAALYIPGPDDGLPANALSRLIDRTSIGRKLRRNYNPWRFRRVARDLLRQHQPKVVHIASRIPSLRGLIIECVRSNVKVVCTIHDPVPHEERRTLWGSFYSRLVNRHFLPDTLSRCDALHVHSALHVEQLLNQHKRLEPGRIYNVQIGVGVPDKIIAGSRRPAELAGIPDPSRTLLFFGRVEPYKGLDLLFEAMKTVVASEPDCKLIVAGAGHLPDIPREVREHVVLLNRFIDDAEIRPIFEAASFVVLPYRSATQTAVVPFAAVFSLPAIVTRVGGLPELLIDNVTGTIVAPADSTALASAIVDLLNDPEKARRQGQAAKSHMESRYGWDSIATEHLALYKARFNINS